jgi:hypothetical protein
MRVDGHIEQRRVLKTLEAAGDVSVEGSLVGVVNARDAHFTRSVVGPVAASGVVSFVQAGCGPMMSGGDVTFHQGGCGPVIARGDVSIEQGGTQGILAAGGARIGNGAFVGVVASPKVTVEVGARVLMSMQQAAAFGAAFGRAVGLIVRRGRRQAPSED